jgi:hypothetical protein
MGVVGRRERMCLVRRNLTRIKYAKFEFLIFILLICYETFDEYFVKKQLV